jgi:topoisomerase (DNA) II binding protein 1
MRRLETNLPEYRPRKPAPKAAVVKAVDHSVVKKKTSTLFRGLVFALVRLSPIAGAVDFDAGQLTSDILSNGGQILSAKVLEALKADSKRQEAQRRTCYVIFWGGYSPTHMSIHTLLSQIQKDDLANLVSVTPIWLQTAITDGKLPSRTKPAVLFQPQSWPLRVLPSCLKIAISGFVQPERTAIIQLIQAVGASCTDSLKPHNTHLICRHPKGPKYEKAVEWKLHTVSIDWLYHVVRYGYGGEKGNEKSGCEAEFSIDDRSRKNSKSVPAQSSGEEEDVKQLVSSSQEVSETQF